ncbi:MAG: alpha/beta hydrolase [Myxococcota bacterium]
MLDALNIKQAVFLGHSMGVQLILEFALRCPQRILGLVPMCGSYGHPLTTFHHTDLLARGLPTIRQIVRRFPGAVQWLWSRAMTTELVYQVSSYLEVNHSLIRREDLEFYFEHLATMDVQAFVTTLEQLNEHTVEDRLGEIDIPTLIVAGERDTFTPSRLSHRMHQLIKNSQLLMIPGGTHVAPIEIPELVHLRLREFLAGLKYPRAKAVGGARSRSRTKKKNQPPTSVR